MQPFGLLGGVGGASAFADLTDKATADLPTINTPLTTALAGKVTGAASSTNNAIVRFDGTTGKLVQNSSATLSDTGTLTVLGADSLNTSISLKASGSTGFGLTVTNAGNVGIGTTSPVNLLSLYKPAGVLISSIQSAGTSWAGVKVSNGTDPMTYWNSGNDFRWGITTANDGGTGFSEYLRISSTGNLGIGVTLPTAKLDVNSDIIRLRTAKTPASATATGNQGDMCWDANYVYVCVATNTWKRSALTTW